MKSLALTAFGAALLAVAVQAMAWKNMRVTRCILAFPLVTIFLVFFAITAASGAANGVSATLAAQRELLMYIMYTLASLVFALLWLAALPSAVRAFGCGPGVCASGLFALSVWALGMGALLASRMLDRHSG